MRRHKKHCKDSGNRTNFHWNLALRQYSENFHIAIENINMVALKRYKMCGRMVSSLARGKIVDKLAVVAEKYGIKGVNTDMQRMRPQQSSGKVFVRQKDGMP